jgi:hypothetical protein
VGGELFVIGGIFVGEAGNRAGLRPLGRAVIGLLESPRAVEGACALMRAGIN